MKNFVLVSIACTLIIFGCSSAKDTNKELVNKVSVKKTIIPTILISIDGFANHYLQTYQPKNILKLAEGATVTVFTKMQKAQLHYFRSDLTIIEKSWDDLFAKKEFKFDSDAAILPEWYVGDAFTDVLLTYNAGMHQYRRALGT